MGRQPDPPPEFTKWLAGVRARLKIARIECGYSYREAEARTGVPFASIRRVEAGPLLPNVLIVYRLAVGYGVDVAELLCESGSRRPRRA